MEIDPEQDFRRAMAAFATGVTVVTAERPGVGLAGITVNSLTSVSLKPRLLLWCLGDQSERYDLFSKAEAWGVTVLGAGEGALARRYAKAETEAVATSEAELFAGSPVLKAGIAQLACRTFDRKPMGDHLMIVGEVIDVRAAEGDALLYFRSQYGRAEDPRSR